MECTVCQKDNSKYKCPTCIMPYCSVICYRRHKENPCEPPCKDEALPVEEPYTNEYEYPTVDTVPPEKLKLLEQSESLKMCIQNPHLLKILEEIDACPRPDRMIKNYMQEILFTEFVDECLKVIEPKTSDDDFL